jgi:DNA polymerase-3 subunit epsilon
VTFVGLPRFAVVDLETSGFSTRRHRILQLGMVTVEADGTVIDEWSTLVKLRWPLARVGPTHIHGLRRRDLRGAPPIDDVLSEFADRLGDSMFTAHNARFDGGFIDAALERRTRNRGGDEMLTQRLCTLRMSRRLDPDRQLSHRLGDVCERYGVSLDRPHDALADATATAAILPHLLRSHGIRDVDDLAPFFDHPAAR